MNNTNSNSSVKQILLKYLPYIVLFFAVFALYGKTIGYNITANDDNAFIHGNADHYGSKTLLKDIFTKDVLFGGGFTPYYRPLLTLTFAVEHKLAGTSAHFAHLTNIILHLISCFIVFFFFRRYLSGAVPALIAALIFAVHPANIYTAAWIPGRNDSLLFIFLLLSLIFFIEYTKKEKASFIVCHFICFLLLLFTKESAVIMPALFVLYLLTWQKDKKLFPSYIWIAVVWIAQISFFIFLQRRAVPEMSFITGAIKCFYPANISMFFEYYTSMFFLTVPLAVNITVKSFVLGSLAIAFTVYLAFFCGKEKLKMFFYFIIPFFVIAPTMPGGRIWYQGNRMYIPLFAVLALCLICFDAFYRNNQKYKKQIMAAAAALVLLCSAVTFVKSDLFKNSMTFWSAVYKDANNPSIIIQNLYADALLRFGYPDEAFPAIEKAMADSKNANLSTVYNLANYHFILGEYEKAASYFEAAVQNPTLADAETYANLFICSRFLNNEEAAKFYYGKTSQKLENSFEKTNEFVLKLMKNLELTQNAYKKRKAENKLISS